MKEIVFTQKTHHADSSHRVVYIEYQGGRVHAVVTDNFDGWCNYFDFENDCNECQEFMQHWSGSGGSIKEIQAPTYADGCTGASYWIHPSASFTGEPKNITRLEAPISYNGEVNPFNVSREISSVEYCEICDKHYDEDLCPEHHEVNEEGQVVYPDGSLAE